MKRISLFSVIGLAAGLALGMIGTGGETLLGRGGALPAKGSEVTILLKKDVGDPSKGTFFAGSKYFENGALAKVTGKFIKEADGMIVIEAVDGSPSGGVQNGIELWVPRENVRALEFAPAAPQQSFSLLAFLRGLIAPKPVPTTAPATTTTSAGGQPPPW
jgi:hypothetical protein